ncbi:tetratricopeptide repeat protein [Rugamonas sp.]|uniref:tetratricopeptide repeat protein n=1 Tax=Rugamonas sp. TaxID=1926287 RepID=UPI0025E74633|nr:tetratricopeptide repeat protein [Rugamonas sp.]
MSLPVDEAEVLFKQGNQRLASGDLAGAEDCYARVLALAPEQGAALANLAWLKEQGGALEAAEALYRRAVAALPEHAQLHRNFGVLLWTRKRFGEAELVGRRAIELAPRSAAGWSNLGVLLACVRREAEAEQCHRRAIALDADYAKARYNLAYLLLRQGRWSEGWPLLDLRWQFDATIHRFDCPRWNGEPLAGKAIVIGFEAGHGDMIHFCRYAACVKALGAARVAVVCQPGLTTLFQTLAGVDQVYGADDDVPADGWDFWTLPMGLPKFFDTRIDHVHAPIPYLSADSALTRTWSAALPRHGLRVGLAWKGNPNFENDGDRSLPSLQTLAPLGAVAGVRFVSLQKGPGEAEAEQPPRGMDLYPAAAGLTDFAATAALIASLDLVISVDTAVAHLAGALGKPCWLLLPDYRTDWRWLSGRADTPWYPQMRLFRQRAGAIDSGGWDAVIADVAAALALTARAAPAA